MPTLAKRDLGDLEAERENYLRYEQMLLAEHAESLRNLRNHLDSLDEQIVGLGGTARASASNDDASTPEDDAALLASLKVVPSVAPFASAESSEKVDSKAKKKSRGKKRKEVGPAANENDNAASSNKKKRGRPKKDKEGKENASSNSTPDGEAAAPKKEKKKRGRKSKTNEESVAAASEALDPALLEPWTCECGEKLAASRSRCGKCRKWRGGKRGKRWSCKPKRGAAGGASANVKKLPKTADAVDVYRNLPAAQPKSGVIAAKAEESSNPRPEVEALMGQMVLAVSSVPFLGEAAAKEASGENQESAKDPSKKRKRGRPKKEQAAEGIQRTVSTSESDSGSAKEEDAPRKRGRPRKAERESGEKVQTATDALQALKQSPSILLPPFKAAPLADEPPKQQPHVKGEAAKKEAEAEETEGALKLSGAEVVRKVEVVDGSMKQLPEEVLEGTLKQPPCEEGPKNEATEEPLKQPPLKLSVAGQGSVEEASRTFVESILCDSQTKQI